METTAVSRPTVFQTQSLAMPSDVREGVAVVAQMAHRHGTAQGNVGVACQQLTIGADALVQSNLRCSGVGLIRVDGRIKGIVRGEDSMIRRTSGPATSTGAALP